MGPVSSFRKASQLSTTISSTAFLSPPGSSANRPINPSKLIPDEVAMPLSEQEVFWTGSFGDEYVDRNKSPVLAASVISLWSRVLARTRDIKSAIEFGANIGNNLAALRSLLPGVELHGVEINKKAFDYLTQLDGVTAHHASLIDFDPPTSFDLTFTSGVLRARLRMLMDG
jgi:hypothetical protein